MSIDFKGYKYILVSKQIHNYGSMNDENQLYHRRRQRLTNPSQQENKAESHMQMLLALGLPKEYKMIFYNKKNKRATEWA